MKKNFFFFLFLFSFTLCKVPPTFSQANLVPNPSFEQFSSCPLGSYQIDKVVSWSAAGGSPDYFNVCAASGGASVPTNFYGYQAAANGNAYVGLYTYNKGVPFPNNREHIQATLSDPLAIGIKYYVSFDVSYSRDNIEIGYASDKLGVLFTNVSNYSSGNPPNLNNNSQVFIDTIISDTANWYHFEGSFTADSAYQKILIGNLFNDANTDTLGVDTSLYTAYYFIDNVCVSSSPDTCNILNSTNSLTTKHNSIDIYPNPTNGKIFINASINEIVAIQIYNIFGDSIIENNVQSNTVIDLSNYSDGIYLIKAQIGQQFITNKIVLTK